MTELFVYRPTDMLITYVLINPKTKFYVKTKCVFFYYDSTGANANELVLDICAINTSKNCTPSSGRLRNACKCQQFLICRC